MQLPAASPTIMRLECARHEAYACFNSWCTIACDIRHYYAWWTLPRSKNAPKHFAPLLSLQCIVRRVDTAICWVQGILPAKSYQAAKTVVITTGVVGLGLLLTIIVGYVAASPTFGWTGITIVSCLAQVLLSFKDEADMTLPWNQ